jgi:uncharacterized protein
LCNRLFSLNVAEVTKKQADKMIQEILTENEIVYFNYRELMTNLQFKILKAVAREEVVDKPYSNQFLRKHDLGSASSVKTGIEALVKRGLLVYNQSLRITDWYFSLWLKNQL